MEILQGVQELSGSKIGIVTARFNWPVTQKLEKSAIQYLENMGAKEDQVVATRVPGAYEIPLAAKHLLDSGCDAVITLGAVIRGETTHYDAICNSVERGCSELQLKYTKPVVFGVLTTENAQQAYDRADGTKENKGAEAAQVAIEMLNLKKVLV